MAIYSDIYGFIQVKTEQGKTELSETLSDWLPDTAEGDCIEWHDLEPLELRFSGNYRNLGSNLPDAVRSLFITGELAGLRLEIKTKQTKTQETYSFAVDNLPYHTVTKQGRLKVSRVE